MRYYFAKYCDHFLMEISSLILPSLLRQCSHQAMNRAVPSKDARIRAQDNPTARTSRAWPSPTGLMSQHLSVLAYIFKNWTQISFIFFLELVLLQGINCSVMWAHLHLHFAVLGCLTGW